MREISIMAQLWRKVFVAVLAVVALFPTLVAAQAAISQGFTTKEAVIPGTILSLESNATNSVLKGSLNTASDLVGVVGEGSLVELSRDSNDKQVQVVTSGVTEVLVSDINGLVDSGDKITISPINGVGMKVLESGTIIGTAQEDFNRATSVTEQEVVDKDGNRKKVKVGLLNVQVNVSYYEKLEQNKTILPSFISDIANTIAGRSVSPVRVIAALVVLLVGVGAITALLYSSVRSSIISIGRNPLASSAVNRSLFEVALFALGILLIMLVGVYLILAI